MFNFFKRQKAEPSAAAQDDRPTPGKSRQIARAVTRMFTAGEENRLTMKWGSTPLSADAVVTRWQRTLVARSREQAANSDHGKSYVRMCRQNIVGPNGVLLQAQVKTKDGKLDTATNDAIEGAWMMWGNRKHCDVTGVESWRSIQTTVASASATDGEAFVHIITGRDAGPWGFALQVIDSTRCPVDMDVQRLNGGSNFIRHGIEFNRYGRPLAYYFTTLDEGESDFTFAGRPHVRVPANQIIHIYRREMVGQKRGIPWMATGLFRMRNLVGFEDAAIINARIGASKMGWIKFAEGAEGPEYDDDNPPEVDVEPGTFGVLPSGADIATFEPQFPSNDFGPFMKHTLRSIASGLGVPYNELANDLEGVNFSSIRQGTLDSREHWKELQEWLVETLVQPVFEAWLEYSLLAGRIPGLKAQNIDSYGDVTWQPRRWDWIDPRADVDAAVASKNNFLKSPSAIIREQGRDPNGVWIESARDYRAQVDALVAEGFTKEEAMELVKMSFGIQPKPPGPNPMPTPKEKPAA